MPVSVAHTPRSPPRRALIYVPQDEFVAQATAAAVKEGKIVLSPVLISCVFECTENPVSHTLIVSINVRVLFGGTHTLALSYPFFVFYNFFPETSICYNFQQGGVD